MVQSAWRWPPAGSSLSPFANNRSHSRAGGSCGSFWGLPSSRCLRWSASLISACRMKASEARRLKKRSFRRGARLRTATVFRWRAHFRLTLCGSIPKRLARAVRRWCANRRSLLRNSKRFSRILTKRPSPRNLQPASRATFAVACCPKRRTGFRKSASWRSKCRRKPIAITRKDRWRLTSSAMLPPTATGAWGWNRSSTNICPIRLRAARPSPCRSIPVFRAHSKMNCAAG